MVVRNVLRLCAVVARTNWRGTGDETQLMFPGVLVFPFPLRERFIGDTVMSIDVFGAINPQAGKLCHCRQRRDNGTMLLVILIGLRANVIESTRTQAPSP